LIGLASDREIALDAVERVSIAGRGGATAAAVLDRACGTVADAFDFDSVAAWQYDMEADDVIVAAVAGEAPADRASTHAIADFSLLAQAKEDRTLVRRPDGDATSAFALPLFSGDRCLGFLSGRRTSTSPRSEPDWGGLGTLGIVAATLLENALVRDELHHQGVLKSEFIALAVHELRNPLSNIYGISVTIEEHRDELTAARSATLLRALVEQTTRMRRLAEQLLDLSRLDLDAIRISPEPLRLRPKIEEVVRSLADEQPGAVTIVAPPDLEVAVDPAALDRMLSNLITNSLRHGRPPVTVTAERRDTHLRLAVEDRGAGVPREFVPHLFHRFARSSESSDITEGSGLGLTIAQAHARAHGGKIVYEQAQPHGARFEVVIPLRRCDERT
jgi:signal transduction histidine kinase